MASRHRVRYSSLSIIKTATVPPALCKRDGTKQFHNSKIAFPVTQKLARCDWVPCYITYIMPLMLCPLNVVHDVLSHRAARLRSFPCRPRCPVHSSVLLCYSMDRERGYSVHALHAPCCFCRPSSRAYKTVFKAVRPSVAVF